MIRPYLPQRQYLIAATAAVLGSIFLFGGALMFGLISPANTGGITTLVPTTPILVRSVAGFLLVGGGFYYLRSGSQTGDDTSNLTAAESPPEKPQSPPELVGTDIDTTIADSRDAVRLKSIEYTQTEVYEMLYETARTTITVTQACSEAEADRLLETGEWTSDTVAQAFLSDTQSYPVTFHVIRWAAPGTAYTIAIEQTSSAIDAMLSKDSSQPIDSSASTDSVDPLRSLVDDIRTTIDAQRRGSSDVGFGSTTLTTNTTTQPTDDDTAVPPDTPAQEPMREDS